MNSQNVSRVSTLNTIYPVLLLTSTAVAALFCYLYLTKPVIVAASPVDATAPMVPQSPPAAVADAKHSAPVANGAAKDDHATASVSLAPSGDRLPGDPAVSGKGSSRKKTPDARRALPATPVGTHFEETNLRVQHILTAETPGGDLSRIVLDVPVLLKTGTLAWTQSDISEARMLLQRLNDHQEKTRQLRDEGFQLLDLWNRLVERTIPSPVLRADSPSLPGNQQAAEAGGSTESQESGSAIQIHPNNP